MKRAKWKFLSSDYWMLAYLKKTFVSKQRHITIYKRSFPILPVFINRNIKIYNGMQKRPIKIESSMVSNKFGSFFFTRKPFLYKKGQNIRKK